MRDNAYTLSDFRVPTPSIECQPCGPRGRYNVARLMEKYGDAKLPELLQTSEAVRYLQRYLGPNDRPARSSNSFKPLT
jgi:hypothetical protein